MLDTDLVNLPVTTKKYHIYDVDALPVMFLGIKVKNKFDEKRIQIKSKYKPKLVTHFELGRELIPIHLYGIEIKPKSEYKGLIDHLNFNHTAITKEQYIDMLNEYDLTCDESYSYLSDGIYPIDVRHIDTISRKGMTSEVQSGFKCMVKKSNIPWYATLLNFNLFILGKSIGYDMDYQLHSKRIVL
jgi:hypothetical protein